MRLKLTDKIALRLLKKINVAFTDTLDPDKDMALISSLTAHRVNIDRFLSQDWFGTQYSMIEA